MLLDANTGLTARLAGELGVYAFEVRAVVSIILVSLVCGMAGPLVVGNRMSFFSNAMSHCAFAGVAIGTLLAISLGAVQPTDPVYSWLVPLTMFVFAALIGCGIAYVKSSTTLPVDTVIGVFFAGVLGFGAVLLQVLSKVEETPFSPEAFLFGSPILVTDIDLLLLFGLFVVAVVFLARKYNQLVFTSFQPSLGRSRGLPLMLNDFLFIVLLALVVNFSIRAVGVLLINGMLIVPAAAALNVARNMRQMFWYTVALNLATGLGGLYLSQTVRLSIRGSETEFGPSGPILLLSVAAFFALLGFGQLRDAWRTSRARRSYLDEGDQSLKPGGAA